MNKELTQTSPHPVPWKRILHITAWIWGFAPMGLWMLWKEPSFSRSLKIRIAVYAMGTLVLLTVLFTMYELHSLQKALQAAGGDY